MTDELTIELDHIGDDICLAAELPMTADPRRVVTRQAPRLLAAVRKVLALHHAKPVYGLAFGGLDQDKPLCGHDPDTDTDAHFEADDGYWYCRDKITGQVCAQCADEDQADLWAEWPCPTVTAITREVLGREG